MFEFCSPDAVHADEVEDEVERRHRHGDGEDLTLPLAGEEGPHVQEVPVKLLAGIEFRIFRGGGVTYASFPEYIGRGEQAPTL